LVHLRVLKSEILCASYCPTSSQILPTSFVKTQTGMSSSDSSSLSTSSSSQSTESDRSRDDRLRGEGVSAGVGTTGMPMEVVREV